MGLKGNDFNNFLAEGIENMRDQGISSCKGITQRRLPFKLIDSSGS